MVIMDIWNLGNILFKLKLPFYFQSMANMQLLLCRLLEFLCHINWFQNWPDQFGKKENYHYNLQTMGHQNLHYSYLFLEKNQGYLSVMDQAYVMNYWLTFFSLYRLVTKNWWLNTKCQPKFLVLFLFEKRRGQPGLFSFWKEIIIKISADIWCLVIDF